MQSVLRKTGQVKIKIWISPRNSVTFNYFFFFCSTRQWGGRYPPANTGGGGEGPIEPSTRTSLHNGTPERCFNEERRPVS